MNNKKIMLYEKLIDAIGEGVVCYTSGEGRILFANKGFVKMLDLDAAPKELVGAKIEDLIIYTEKRGKIRGLTLEKGWIRNLEYSFKTLKGENKWVMISSYLGEDFDTEEKVVETVITDISDKKAFLNEIKYMDAILKSVREVNQVIVKEKKISDIAEKTCSILSKEAVHLFSWIILDDGGGKFKVHGGKGPKCAGGISLPETISRKMLPRCWQKAVEEKDDIIVVRDGDIFCSDCPYRCREGRNYTLMMGKLMWSSHFYGVIGIAVEKGHIPDEKSKNLFKGMTEDLSFAFHDVEVMEDLAENNRKYQDLLDNMFSAVAVYDAVDGGENFIFKEINRAAEKMDKVKKRKIIGHKVTEIFSAVKEFGLFEVFQRVWKTGNPESFPVKLYKDNRIGGWRENYIYKLNTGEIVAVYEDVTDKKKVEEQLILTKLSVDKSSVSVFWANENARFDYANEAACKKLGYSNAEFLKMSVYDIDPIFTKEMWGKHWKELKKKKNILIETVHRRKDGTTFPAEVNANYIKNNDHEYIFAFVSDISERKHMEEERKTINEELEERVRVRTRELENANKELESFSYSVSHDLRVPLRAIDGFSRILAEEEGDRLGENSRHFLDVIRENTKKMADLIDDLLVFSHAGRKEIRSVKINMEQLVANAFEALKPLYKDRKINIKIGKLPFAYGDKALINQVIMNILANAVKFTRNEGKAEIQVKAKETEDEIVYCIKDNGAGFDPRYTSKIFDIFQRLHLQEDFEGTGVGLAIVHRVVAKHSGRVWAEGKVNGGATFYFALPKKQKRGEINEGKGRRDPADRR